METVDERSFKEKWNAFKWNTKEKINNAIQYCVDNPQVAVGVVTGLAFIGKKAIKGLEQNREIKITECRHYDRRADEYYYSKRPLKASEKLRLEREYREGRSKGEILKSMGLLK